ncbi:glycosyltransferase family protein [Hymenobacter tenuis]
MPSPAVSRLRDILQLRFTDLFASLPAHMLESISPASPWKRTAKVAGYAGLRLLGNVFRKVRNPEQLQGKVWLYVVSQNNYDALHFIREARPDTVLVAGQSKQIGRYNGVVNRLSLRRKLLYYGQFPRVYAGLKRTEGGKAWRFFDLIFNAIGYYEVYCRALRHYQPRAIIFANDHNDDSRALLLAARSCGVPTAYVQHASVSTAFPPLGFDLSLLEGQDSLDKYQQCGPVAGRTELVGMPKADAFLTRKNQQPRVQRVAIACNALDETQAIAAAIEYLLREFPDLSFTFRPHPGDPRDFSFLRAQHPRLQFSDARQQNVFEFLMEHDALIAADTSTHLEATLLNLASIYFRFGVHSMAFDYYGYVAHGLVEQAGTLPELAALVRRYQQHKPTDLYQRAAYYNATLGTPDEGHSQQRTLRLLDNWLTEQA